MASPQLRPVPPPPRPPPPPLRAPAPGPPWRDWNTLQKLWASIYLIWGLDALLLMTAVIGAQVHREAVKTIGKDSAPSIIAAQTIKTKLADMDADAANELLGQPGGTPEMVKAYELRRTEAAKALIEAARNITYADELQPIEDIQTNLGDFEVRVQKARDLHQVGEKSYVDAYRDAAGVMDAKLLPRADDLDRVNRDELDKSYNTLSGRSVGSGFMLLMVGAGMLWALFAVQRFLNLRTHRILNPMLLAATLITLAFILYTFSTFASERNRLKVAKEDAFESIHALLRARAIAYAANADESRYLLDTAHATEHEAAFSTKMDSLVKLHAGTSFGDVLATAKQGQKVSTADGELVKELNNITFEDEGERDAAVKTIATFGEYLNVSGDIRRLQLNGKHAEALEMCTGKSNSVFDQFDKALGETVDINQKAFDGAVGRAFDALSYFELKASIIALIIGGLAFFGLLQRIQEYR